MTLAPGARIRTPKPMTVAEVRARKPVEWLHGTFVGWHGADKAVVWWDGDHDPTGYDAYAIEYFEEVRP